jgi:hypothetical protein
MIYITFPAFHDLEHQLKSLVILKYAYLSTTRLYLGKGENVEEMQWIENLYG